LRALTRVQRKRRLARIMPRVKSRLLLVEALGARGPRLFELACERDREGIVAKHRDAPYSTDATRTRWCKIKNVDYTQAQGRYELFAPRRDDSRARNCKQPLSLSTEGARCAPPATASRSGGGRDSQLRTGKSVDGDIRFRSQRYVVAADSRAGAMGNHVCSSRSLRRVIGHAHSATGGARGSYYAAIVVCSRLFLFFDSMNLVEPCMRSCLYVGLKIARHQAASLRARTLRVDRLCA
jgi:hypothetical protein